MSAPRKVSTSGGDALGQNPFAALDSVRSDLPPARASSPDSSRGNGDEGGGARKNRGRADIRRTTAGRGGKTVTVIDGFVGIGVAEKESLAKTMQKRCGCGGTVKDGRIEIQGDKREAVAQVLEAAGFRPVFAGG